MAPTAKQAIEEVAASDDVLWVKALDDVSGKLFALTRGADGRWASRIDAARRKQHDPSDAVSDKNTWRSRSRGDADAADAVRGHAGRRPDQGAEPCRPSSMRPPMRSSSASRPRRTAPACRISWSQEGGRRAGADADPRLWRVPQRADARLSHRPALSRRAARVVLGRAGQRLCPRQHPRRRRIWAEWHEAALRENRQRSFDDLHAVAEDLIRTGVDREGQDRRSPAARMAECWSAPR